MRNNTSVHAVGRQLDHRITLISKKTSTAKVLIRIERFRLLSNCHQDLDAPESVARQSPQLAGEVCEPELGTYHYDINMARFRVLLQASDVS